METTESVCTVAEPPSPNCGGPRDSIPQMNIRNECFFFMFQVGNLGLLFMLLFFIYAALGVELFGELGGSFRHHFCSY